MRELPTAPTFTRSELRRLGWSDSAISRAIGSRRLVRFGRGVFADPVIASLTSTVGLIAATHAVGGSVISHRSALTVHDLPVVGPRPCRPELTVAPFGTAHAASGHVYRASLDVADVTVVDDVPVTSVARTLVDVGRHCPLRTAVCAVDAALHRELVSERELSDVLLRCYNWPGIRRAQRAVRLADGRSESPLESISRLAFPRLQIPAPRPQAVILDDRGWIVGRVDFYWDDLAIAGEADGRAKYADGDETLDAEKTRQERLEDLGLTVFRWGWTDATRAPWLIKQRFLRATQRAEALRRSGLRRNWSVLPA